MFTKLYRFFESKEEESNRKKEENRTSNLWLEYKDTSELLKTKTIPPLTKGSIYNNDFDQMGRKQSRNDYGYKCAKKVVDLYKAVRKDGAASRWVNGVPYGIKIRLSDQAKHNWANSKPGFPFSGMLDARTGLIYLIPATKRGKYKEQKNWDHELLKKQQFTKNGKLLAKNNMRPISPINNKHLNTDHGRAAAYLEGRNYEVKRKKPLESKEEHFKVFLEREEIAKNWLGFFVHSDSKGKPVLNFKSAQLNSPNLSFQIMVEAELFSNLKAYNMFDEIKKKLNNLSSLDKIEKDILLNIKEIAPTLKELIKNNKKLKTAQIQAITKLIDNKKTKLKEKVTNKLCQLPLNISQDITKEINKLPKVEMKAWFKNIMFC